MARFGLLAIPLAAAVAAACGSTAPVPVVPTAIVTGDIAAASPAPRSVVQPGPCTIGFAALTVHRAPYTTHEECGLTVNAAAASWQVSTTYGHPAPFVQFLADGGSTITGEIIVKSSDTAFTFMAVDIYSSTTKIPYEFIGTLGGAEAFSTHDVQGNTFGDFATIPNARFGDPIDTLRIRLTNPAAPCCTNPVGLDNIRVIR
jgi:hypothetical protein